LASISHVQVLILKIRNPKQIQKTENPKFKTPIVIPGGLGASSRFFVWNLGFVSDFEFRISDFSVRLAVSIEKDAGQWIRLSYRSNGLTQR